MGWEKVACWSTKAAISLKRVKIEEKLLWMTKFGWHTNALSNGAIPDPLWPPLPQDWGFATPPQTSIAIISGTGKATDFKFGRYIHRVHPNKKLLKIFGKRERGRIQGLPKVLKYPLLSQEQVKLQTSNFVRTFIRSISIGTKAR